MSAVQNSAVGATQEASIGEAGGELRAARVVSVERDLVREIKARNHKMFEPHGSCTTRYPPIRDHHAVLAIQRWLTAVDGLSTATVVVRDNLPGSDLRQVMIELSGFTKRARFRVGLAVADRE